MPPVFLPSSMVALSRSARANGCRFQHGTHPAASHCNMATEVRNSYLSLPFLLVFYEQNPEKKILYLRLFVFKEMLVEKCSLVNWMSCLCLGCFGWISHAPLSLRMKIFFHLRASISLTLFTVYELCICRQIFSDRGLTCFFSLFFLRRPTLCGNKFRFSISSRFKD